MFLVNECASIYVRLPLRRNPITAVTGNTRPQRFFSSGSNLRFGGTSINRYHGVSRVGPEQTLCPFLEYSEEQHFCNTLLQHLAPLHVKTTRSTNLLSVCGRKLKLSTVSYNHISFLNARWQLV